MPFTRLPVEEHLAKVFTDRLWLATQICDHINEGISFKHDLVFGSGTEQHALHQLQLRPHLQHVKVEFFTLSTPLFSSWSNPILSNRMPFKLGTPACTIDMLTLAANSSRQTNNSHNNGRLFFFPSAHFQVNSSCCCVIIFQLENVHRCVCWLRKGVYWSVGKGLWPDDQSCAAQGKLYKEPGKPWCG